MEIEQEFLTHEDIKEVVVFGIPDEILGEIVAMVCVLQKQNCTKLSLEELRKWSEQRLATYKIPRKLKLVKAIPRNAMGKVNKKQLAKDMVF